MIRNFYVDLTTLGNNFTGVSVYSRNLASHLEARFDCRILAPSYLAAEFQNAIVCPDPIFFKRGLVGRRPFWQRTAGVESGKDSFIYAPHMRGIWRGGRQVITIHDLIAQYYPTRNVIENAFNTHVLPRIARSAVGVVTVSETSRQEIARYFDIDDAKIAVVGNGLDLSLWTPATQPDASGDAPYLLAVSANRPYKNTLELIQHHDLWSARYRLKIVSSKARYGMAIRQAVADAGLGSRVDFLDDLSEEALIDLYRHCAAAVYPSLIEGFGRPALEALAVARPVILSGIAVHREIFGRAAIFVTPGDRDSWVAAFQTLDDQAEVARLVAAGQPLVRQFGWDRMGQALDAVLLRFEPRLEALLRR